MDHAYLKMRHMQAKGHGGGGGGRQNNTDRLNSSRMLMNSSRSNQGGKQ